MGDPRTPAWVVNVREEISRSPAWEVLSDQLYERVSTVLESHGLGHFSDLSSAEQITLLEEAHRDISSEDNKVYKAFESQFGKSMDAEIAKEARQGEARESGQRGGEELEEARVDQDEAAKRDGTDEALYLDRILDSATEGAVSLLRELPREHLGSLRLMLNQSIPSRARLDIWRLLLKHTSVREEYELLMKQNRNSTISGQDIYITHRCQALLESGRVASRRLLPLTSLNVVLMKTVLSYHHARKMNKQGDKAAPNVPESFVHFLVPLCAVATSPSNVKELKIESQIEGLVEMFEGALEAGLEGLVDPKELGGSGIVSGGGGGSGGAGNAATTRAKKAQKPSKTARTTEPSISVVGGGTGDMVIPSWVDKIHGVLVPGFKGLVDHVARVHLGLAVAASIEGRASEHKKEGGSDGNGDGASSIRAAHGQLYAEEKDDKQQGMEGESAAQPPSPRGVSSSSRRAALQLRRRSTDGPTAIAAGSAGGEEEKETGDAPARRPSSTVSPREEADNAEKNAPVPVAPLPRVNESQARAALYALLKPLVTVGLVGYLSADACLFAWDQAVIGGFGAMLPRVAAMVVAAAADKMQACSTFPVMSEALLSHAHVVSTSQLQGLMEAHCMPSIRTEMRVSQKLSPEIIGPSLETATEILHSAYSKRTRQTQEARKNHVEHVLGPSKGGPINRINTKERFQLDLPRSIAHGSGGSSKGDSSVDLRYDDSDDDDDDDDDDDNVDDNKGKKSPSVRLGKARGRLGGRERQKKDGNDGAKKKGAWRDMLSHRSASSNAASAHGVAEETLARAKTTGDHSSTRSKHTTSKRDSKKAEGAASTKRDTKKAGGAASAKRDPKKAGEAASTSDSASASVPSLKKAASKKTANKEQDLPGVDNNATKTKRHSGGHGPRDESADDATKIGDDDKRRNPKKSQRRPTARATAETRRGSSASSSLALGSTRRSLESSQYFSAESDESSHARGGEREESSKDGKKEAAAREDSVVLSSDRRRRARSGRRRRQSEEESSPPSLDDESDVSVDATAGKKLEKKPPTRLVTRETSRATTDRGGGGAAAAAEGGDHAAGGDKAKTKIASAAGAKKGPPPQPDTRKRDKGRSTTRRRSLHSQVSRGTTERDGREEDSEKSAKGSYKAREASKEEKKKKGRTAAGENSISEGGAPAAAASPEPAAAAASTSTSPLKRWLGFGGRKKASPPSSPAKETKAQTRTKANKDMSSWMLD